MVYLLLSILSSTCIYLLFKLFQRWEVQILPAIVFNYFVAFAVGLALIPKGASVNPADYEWSWMIPIEGILFISIFNVMALTVQKYSVTVSSLASRTAMIIPAIVLMVIDPSSSFSVLKVLGIVLALVAVWLSSRKGGQVEMDQRYLYLPIILFVGSGLIDLLLGYAQSHLMQSEEELLLFTPGIFLTAGTIGTVILTYRYAIRKDIRWQLKDALAGVLLGIVNYASLYFILKALDANLLHESLFFPLNHMGIIVASSLMGLFIFRERLSRINWLGLALGLVAITLILLADSA